MSAVRPQPSGCRGFVPANQTSAAYRGAPNYICFVREVPGLRFHRGGFYCTDEGQEVTIRDKGLQKGGTFAVMRASNLHGDATPLLGADKTITVAHQRLSAQFHGKRCRRVKVGWVQCKLPSQSLGENNLCRVSRCKPRVGTSGSDLGGYAFEFHSPAAVPGFQFIPRMLHTSKTGKPKGD